MAKNSIGLIELTSIAAGFQACDAMLKAADVELVLARSICSGKYMVMVRGDVAAVEASVAAGIAEGKFWVIDSFVIPNLHESIFPAISGRWRLARGAGDCRILLRGRADRRRGRGREGRQRATDRDPAGDGARGESVRHADRRRGRVIAAQAAIEAGARVVGAKGMLVNKVVIPHPRPELPELEII